jgi:FixJ family two-component response regulator
MSGSPKTSNRFLIAIVDDDQSVCQALESLLRSLGFSYRDVYLSARVPRLASIAEHIVRDSRYMHANMNGIELQRHLMATHSLPIIFITAYGDDRMEQQVTRAGAICLLRKPFRDEALIDALSSALGI